MERSELRIGNFIYDDENEIVKVEGIDSNRKIEYDGNELGISFSKFLDEVSLYESEIINPIPLTEEWLIKLGFKEDETNAGFVKDCGRKSIIVGNAQDDDFVLLYRSDVGLNYYDIDFVDHVHQLQNLYFALCGEELEHN